MALSDLDIFYYLPREAPQPHGQLRFDRGERVAPEPHAAGHVGCRKVRLSQRLHQGKVKYNSNIDQMVGREVAIHGEGQ